MEHSAHAEPVMAKAARATRDLFTASLSEGEKPKCALCNSGHADMYVRRRGLEAADGERTLADPKRPPHQVRLAASSLCLAAAGASTTSFRSALRFIANAFRPCAGSSHALCGCCCQESALWAECFCHSKADPFALILLSISFFVSMALRRFRRKERRRRSSIGSGTEGLQGTFREKGEEPDLFFYINWIDTLNHQNLYIPSSFRGDQSWT